MPKPRICDALHGPMRASPSLQLIMHQSLVVGANAFAGVGVGVLPVMIAAALAAILPNGLVLPSALLKLAGGLAGGGVGLMKVVGERRRLKQIGTGNRTWS